MIGYALLPDHIDLSDHPELVADIRDYLGCPAAVRHLRIDLRPGACPVDI
ncbi:hypothetical protein [Streptomyces sp. cg36]